MKLQICPRQTLQYLAKLPGLRRCELPVKVVRLPVLTWCSCCSYGRPVVCTVG
jgi:hypothetical protein